MTAGGTTSRESVHSSEATTKPVPDSNVSPADKEHDESVLLFTGLALGSDTEPDRISAPEFTPPSTVAAEAFETLVQNASPQNSDVQHVAIDVNGEGLDADLLLELDQNPSPHVETWTSMDPTEFSAHGEEAEKLEHNQWDATEQLPSYANATSCREPAASAEPQSSHPNFRATDNSITNETGGPVGAVVDSNTGSVAHSEAEDQSVDLPYLNQVRKRVAAQRSDADVKGKHVINVCGRLRKILDNVRARAFGDGHNMDESNATEDLTTWVTDFDFLRDQISEAEKAVEDFRHDCDISVRGDYVLGTLERGYYASHDESYGTLDREYRAALRMSKGLVNLYEHSRQSSDKLIVADDQRIAGPPSMPPLEHDENYADFYSDYLGGEDEHVTYASYDSQLPDDLEAMPSSPAANSDQLGISEVKPSLQEDAFTAGSGSQFLEVPPPTLTALEFFHNVSDRSAFKAAELDAFTDWLLSEPPWSPGYSYGRDKVIAAISNVAFLRTWLMHAVSSQFFGRTSELTPSATHESVSAYTQDFFKSWFRNPFNPERSASELPVKVTNDLQEEGELIGHEEHQDL